MNKIDYLALSIFILKLTPILNGTVTNVVVFGLILVWVIKNIFKIIKYKGKDAKWLLIILGWFVIGSIIAFINYRVEVVKNNILELVSLVFPYIVFKINYDNIKKNYNIYYRSIISIMLIENIISIILYRINFGKSYYREVKSYINVYITIIFIIIIIYNVIYISKHDKYIKKIYKYIIIAICIINIIISGYTIANIILIIGYLIIVYGTYNHGYRKIFKYFIVMFVLIIIINYGNVFELLLRNIKNRAYFERINDINNYLNGSNNFSTLTARINAYFKSINAFINHPCFGSIWYINKDYNIASMIGYHSTILDNLGLFGIFGLIPIYIIINPIIGAYNKFREHRYLIMSALISFCLIITLDNQIPGIGIIVYYFLNLFLIKTNYNGVIKNE